jgi:hypothetical protein
MSVTLLCTLDIFEVIFIHKRRVRDGRGHQQVRRSGFERVRCAKAIPYNRHFQGLTHNMIEWFSYQVPYTLYLLSLGPNMSARRVRKLNALQTHTPYFAFTAATHPGISSLARESFATAHVARSKPGLTRNSSTLSPSK